MTILGLILLAVASWLAARALGRAGLGGTHGHPAIVGGLLAGALLGPTLLGRLAPDAHEDLFVGARAARQVWSAHRAEDEAAAAARRASGIESGAVSAVSPETAATEAHWRQASWRARSAQRIAAIGGAILLLVLAGGDARRRIGAHAEEGSGSPRADGGGVRVVPQPRSRHGDALLIGLWSAGLPALAMVLVLWTHGLPTTDQAALLALACVAVGAWALTVDDLLIAERAEPGGAALVAAGTVWATLIAAALLALAAFSTRTAPEAAPAPPNGASFAQTGALASLAIAAVAGAAFPASRRGRLGALVPWAVRWALPPVVALGMVRVELFRDLGIWLLVATALIAGDGRVTGAFLGAWLPGGRTGVAALRLALPASAAAPPQVALAAVGMAVGVLDASCGMALLLAGGFMELMGGTRARVDRALGGLEPPRA